MHIAINEYSCKNKSEMINCFINNKGLINKMASEKKTALDYAIKQGTKKIIDLLRKHGAKTGEECR